MTEYTAIIYKRIVRNNEEMRKRLTKTKELIVSWVDKIKTAIEKLNEIEKENGEVLDMYEKGDVYEKI